MLNMSYCRYENTLNDLRDCFNDMQERAEDGEGPLSTSETQARKSLIQVCRDIIELEDSLEPELDQDAAFVEPEQSYSAEALTNLKSSHGEIRLKLNDDFFIWRDQDLFFLCKISDDEFMYQLDTHQRTPEQWLAEANQVIAEGKYHTC